MFLDFFFFFFQAEDGIRDLYVTGVQTCALPISRCVSAEVERRHAVGKGRQDPPRAEEEAKRARGRLNAHADDGARLGNLFGFPIFAHASLIISAPLVFIALFMTGMGNTSLLDGFAFVGVVIVSVVTHEL